jgi:hypothetical protein
MGTDAAHMTDADHDKAALDKIRAETALIKAQTRKTRAENNQKLQIEIGKMMAETDKLRAETRWYWLIAVSTLGVGVLAALSVIAVKLIHG